MSILDLLDDAPAPSAPVDPNAGDAQLTRGLRSGSTAVGGQMRALAGGVGEALGADEFARRQFELSREAQAQAAAEAPRVGSYKDVHSIRDAFDYGTGTLGSMIPAALPAIGAGLVTRNPRAAIAAGAAAMAPGEIGDVLQREQEDPAAMALSPQERLGRAGLAGGASALAQTVVPAIVGGKLAGRTIAKGAGKTLGEAAKGAAAELPVMAGAGVGGEAAKEVGTNPDRPLDVERLKEAGVAGLVGGVPLVGAGVAAEAAHGRLEGRKPAPAPDAGTKAAPDVRDGLAGLGAGKDDSVDRIMAGEPLGDLKAFAGAEGDKLNDLHAESIKAGAAKAAQWGRDLLAKADLSPEKRQEVTDALGNLGEQASQIAIATIKKGQDVAADLGGKIDALHAGLSAKSDEGTASPKGDVKHSDDFSGIRSAILNEVAPMLKEHAPDVLENPQMRDKLADVLRMTVERFASGRRLDSESLTKLIDITGDKTADVLAAVQKAVGGEDPKKTEAFFGQLNALNEVQSGRKSVTDLMAKYLKPELHNASTPRELSAEAAMLEKWAGTSAKGEQAAHQAKLGEKGGAKGALTTEEMKFKDQKVRDALEHRYGDKADTILKAVEKNREREHVAVETADNMREGSFDDTTSKQTFYSKKKELYLHPDHDKGSNGYESAAAQALKKARTENPDAHVRFAKAEELGQDHPLVQATKERLTKQAMGEGHPRDQAEARAAAELTKHGVVVAESTKQETALSKGDIDGLKVDTSKTSHANSPTTLRTGEGGPLIDAVKLGEFMNRKLNKPEDYTSADNENAMSRKARMFMEGVAAVQQQLGRAFEIPEDLVIDRKGTTWGSVEALMRHGSLKMADHVPLTGEEGRTIPQMERALSQLRRDYKEAVRKDASDAKLAAIKEKGDTLKQRIEDAHSDERVQRALEESGKLQADPKGNISEQGRKVAPLKTDEAGGTLKKSEAPLTPRERAEARAAKESEGKPVSPRAEREADAKAKAAFVEKANAADPALLKKISESTDPKSLQAAVEHLARVIAESKDEGPQKLQKTIDTINARLGELVQSPTVAYGMATKKFSLVSEVIHAALGREGIAAAHDSMHKFTGFNWREHMGKGEGNSAFGAGTYLSTGDVVHKYYKTLATQNAGETSPTYHVTVDIKPDQMLNWNKKGSEQNPGVIEKLKAAGIYSPYKTGEDLYHSLMEIKFGHDMGRTPHEIGTGKSQPDVSNYLQSIGILGHEYAANNGKDVKAPNYVIYDDSKIGTNYVAFSAESAPAGGGATPEARQAAFDQIKKSLGPTINVEWKPLLHAGEFERVAGTNGHFEDTIRLSMHSLNPMSAGFHESLHAFFAKLTDAGQHDIKRVLERFAESAPVLNQLKDLLKNQPEALKQLSDHEERAAYAYQFWADGKLKVGPDTQSLFQRVATFIKNTLGIWSNDQRALHMMEYLQTGKYARDMRTPSAVREALMETGTNRAVEALKAMVSPVQELGETIAVAGGARLRDTGIPALRELADSMKLKTTSEGGDAGYLPTARAEKSRAMNQLGADLKGFSPAHVAEALEALQTGTKPASTEARTVRLVVRKRLDEMFGYMKDAGVRVNDLGVGKDYFPRSWDSSYISSHQAEFLAMAQKYVASGQLKTPAKELMQKMMVTDGAEFNVEVDKPGMQHIKERVLSFISHEDAAPFMRKNMYEILNSYITQATRRAEWARRFGDDGQGVQRLYERAKQQGATDEQIKDAKTFVRSVDGTLGDKINPTARRLMGNMIVYQNVRLLPLAIFSSLVDPLGIVVRGGTIGDAFKTFNRGIKEVAKNFSRDASFDKSTDLAATIGVIDSAMLVHTLGASYSQGMVGNTGRRVNDMFFRLNLMEQFNSSMRVGATEASLKFLQRHAAQESRHSERYLSELGLTKDDVQLDANGRVKVLTSDGLTPEHAARMQMAVNRWVDGAVLRPDAVDKPPWMSDPHFALVSHLKQFVFSFHETILKRVAHEAAHGNYTPAMALAAYVPTMIASDLAKGLIQGGGQQPSWKQDWDAGDYVWSGVERGGLLGTGQFAADAYGDIQKGGSGIGALLGPTVEQLTEATRTLGGNEQFKTLAVKSMPANALYAAALKTPSTDPKFVD